MQGLKIYEYEKRYSNQSFLSSIDIYKPTFFKLILILVNSLYASLIAMFAYSLSLVTKARGISIIALVSIGVYVLNILVSNLGLKMKFSMLMYQQGGPGNLLCFTILIVLWIMLIFIILMIGIKKDVI